MVRHSPLNPGRQDVAVLLLSEAVGEPVSVRAVEPLGHDSAAVSRLVLSTPAGGVGSAVVKTVRTDGASHGGRPFLRREIAPHRLLGAESAGPSVAAHLFGSDVGAGVMVVEDVFGTPLAESLLGGSAARATHDLSALGAAVGQLHRQSTDGPPARRRRVRRFDARPAARVSVPGPRPLARPLPIGVGRPLARSRRSTDRALPCLRRNTSTNDVRKRASLRSAQAAARDAAAEVA